MGKAWTNSSRFYERHSRFEDREWIEYSRAVFEAFHKANPVQYARDYTPCILDIGEHHICPNRDLRCGKVGLQLQDHDELCCFADGEKLIVSHPYMAKRYIGIDAWPNAWSAALQELTNWRSEIPTLSAMDAGMHRSWYSPGHSRLVFIGTLQALSRVNLDYEVPTDTAPAAYACFLDDADEALEPHIGPRPN